MTGGKPTQLDIQTFNHAEPPPLAALPKKRRWYFDLVIAPVCPCRLCCRDEMEIKKTAHAGRLFFCPSAVGGRFIFLHRLKTTETPTERRHRYALTLYYRTNERHTESHGERPSERPKHRHRTAHTGPAAPTQGGRGAEKDRHRQSRKRSKFGSMTVKISPVKISKFERSKFTLSNFHLRHYQDSVVRVHRSIFAHQEDCSE